MAKIRARLETADGGAKQIVAILLAAHEKGVDAVERACAEALESGLRSADAVLNILSRHEKPETPPAIEPPPHLRLREDPIADCARYDQLVGAPTTGSVEARHGAA